MRKGAGIWVLLVACAVLILGALALMTRVLLEMEGERIQGDLRAEQQEKIRQALVQMDGVATAILIEENQRDSADFAELVRSDEPSEWVKLRFEFGGGVPMNCPTSGETARLGGLLSDEYEGLRGFEVLCAPVTKANLEEVVKQAESEVYANREPRSKDGYQQALNQTSQANRAWTVEDTLQKVVAPQKTASGEVARGVFEAKWLEDELFLIRPVGGEGSRRFQGVWLETGRLGARLLEEARGLLASPSLVPIAPGNLGQRSLVSLPWQLEVPAVSPARAGWTPLRVSLLVGWIAVLLALLAAAALVRGVMALSERRADFVSSVTHELRTPLTTFRLYSGMLADGMVADDEAKSDYLHTMQGEAERLHHLVENVLAYSRIERGGQAVRKERASLGQIISRCEARLRERTDREGAELRIVLEDPAFEIETDLTGIEQILFNLVDNACKYGLPAEGPGEVVLEARARNGKAEFRVCDRGPGVKFSERRRLFRPFHKSAEAAAGTKPGVGLGLSLCRRLARALGGDLRLENSKAGACFCLHLD